LPRLDSQTDDEYAAYKLRASFFNATARTADGFVGLIFRREPKMKLPDGQQASNEEKESTPHPFPLPDRGGEGDCMGKCEPICSSASFQVEHSATAAVEQSMVVKDWRSRARHFWRNEIRPLLVLGLVLCAIRSSFADWNDVPTGSMKPTILEGDRVFVNKLAYDLKVPFTTWHLAEWANPQRGDIVVFYSPHDGTRLVKRVIGLPGDLLELRGDQLFLNGQPAEYSPLDAAVSCQLP
jgi:signal peptidase I